MTIYPKRSMAFLAILTVATLTICHLYAMEPTSQETPMDIEAQAPDISPAAIQVFMLLTELEHQHLLPHELVYLLKIAYVDLDADVNMEALRDLSNNLDALHKFLESMKRSLRSCDSGIVVVLLKKCLRDAGKSLCAIKNHHNETVLDLACQEGYQNCVKIILHVACDLGEVSTLIFMKNAWGNTALHRAVRWRHTECINALLSQANKLGKAWELIKETDNENNTALHETSGLADLDNEAGCAFIIQAFHYAPNDKEAWNLIQAVDRFCYTVLHDAAFMGHLDLINALIKTADNLGKKNVLIFKQSTERKGESALHRAVHNRQTAVIRTLLEAVGPMAWELISLQYEGKTALDWAISNGHEDVIEILESYRPNQL